ncbi:low-density lipoprotein receptor-related protein 6-like [Haliotis cracherodii]|uniref:low-density lipoprotein receptor-related protein 6-like n=1 Tax=Haliotis cracherodii TaxID=6455 RepID=UPI0039E9C1D5
MKFLWLSVFTLFISSSFEEDGKRFKLYKRQWDLDGKTVQNEVTMGITSVNSKRHCASLCTTNSVCISFFFNTESHACKLVDKQINSSDTLVDEIHSLYYETNICCRYVPTPTPTGIPRLAVAQGSVITMFNYNGTSVLTINTQVRAMFYHPFQERLYLGTNPLTSVNLNGTDERTHGSTYTGTLMALEIDMYDDNIYMSVSNYLVERLAPDGVLKNIANNVDVYKPRQNRLDTVNSVLYWADEALQTVKSVTSDGASTVKTLFTSRKVVWGMDIDFNERKIYWCAKSTGEVWVFDVSTATNTKLVPNGGSVSGSCSGLRLYNDYIYLIYYRLNYIEKRHKNGSLAAKILEGQISASTTKYFAIVE